MCGSGQLGSALNNASVVVVCVCVPACVCGCLSPCNHVCLYPGTREEAGDIPPSYDLIHEPKHGPALCICYLCVSQASLSVILCVACFVVTVGVL